MINTATIAKEFTFHAAHKLPNHNGPCKDLHGHTYKLTVLVTGPIRRTHDVPDEGMVLDFAILKAIYEGSIKPWVDHKYLNSEFQKKPHGIGLPGDEDKEPITTCENIAGWILEVYQHNLLLPDFPPSSVCIRLWETPTSFAEVGRAPWRGD